MLETNLKKIKVAVYCRLLNEQCETEDDKLKKFRNKLNKNFKKYLLNNYEKKRVKYRLPLKNTKSVTYQTSADGDSEYLNRCLKFYKDANVYAVGKKISEEHIYEQLPSLLNEFKPDIVIITGHDAYYRKKGDINDIKNYKNTGYFIKAIKSARKYEKSHEKLVIIAGACQSNYEALIEAGANFASSPKRVNIHALDPAIIATTLALTARNKEINLIELLEKTKYGKEGMGGIISNGLMYVGFPR